MKSSIFLYLVLTILFLWNCDCEDLSPTVIEEFPDPFLVIDDDNNTIGVPDGELFFFDITFNKIADTASLKIGESILFDGLDSLWFNGFLFPDNRIFFGGKITDCTSDDPICNGKVTITLKSNGENVVRSEEGQILDGDGDGTDGGEDFVSLFEF